MRRSSILTVSSKGQVVLPAPLRARLGLNAGAKLEVVDDGEGLHLKVIRAIPKTEIENLAGMVTAPSKGRLRHLEDFRASDLTRRKRR